MTSRRGAVVLATVLTVTACTGAPSRDEPPPDTDRQSVVPGAAKDSRCRDVGHLARRVGRGYVPFRSPDILFIPHEPNYVGTAAAPVHSGPWDYLAEVPLVFYGPGHISSVGDVDEPATMADVAPTTAALIGFAGLPKRDGRILREALSSRRPAPPRLVVTVVWDGGGRNVLGTHRRSWPFLRALMRRGASYTRMTIGSSPSVTPPIHTTLGTGAFPSTSGIPGLTTRVAGPQYVDPFLGLDPSGILVPTLADLYDKKKGNRPIAGMLAVANWHLGMIGHGASHPRGDRDAAVLFNAEGDVYTNSDLYSLPAIARPARLQRYVRELDASDGALDGQWQGRSLNDPEILQATPAAVRYEQDLLERLISSEGFGRDRIPDLLYVNFKPSDGAGHKWGMNSPEVGDVLAEQDRALRQLVARLDSTVGQKRWVVIVTADHGQTPYPQESGAWPIGGGELKEDANEKFDQENPDLELVDRVVSPGAYVREDELRANGVSLEEIGGWMGRYTVGDNKGDQDIAAWYEGPPGDPVFDAVMVGRRIIGGPCSQEARE
jgi:hypothetical protein